MAGPGHRSGVKALLVSLQTFIGPASQPGFAFCMYNLLQTCLFQPSTPDGWFGCCSLKSDHSAFSIGEGQPYVCSCECLVPLIIMSLSGSHGPGPMQVSLSPCLTSSLPLLFAISACFRAGKFLHSLVMQACCQMQLGARYPESHTSRQALGCAQNKLFLPQAS